MEAKTKSFGESFTPITFEFTVESKGELLLMWHRLNISAKNIEHHSASADYHPHPKKFTSTTKLWNELDAVLMEIHDNGH
jgi:hypothetical protein